MIYFYADLPYKGSVFRLLKPESGSNEAVNEMLERQGAIQMLDTAVIALFSFRGSYQYIARPQVDRELVHELINSGQIPPYDTLVWIPAHLD